MCTLSSLHSLCAYALFFSSLSDVSSRYRTISGGSVESGPLTCTQTPAISLPTLTEYIQQLRAYLPNANVIGLQVHVWIHTMKWTCHMHALCFCVHVSLAVLSGLVHWYLEKHKTYIYTCIMMYSHFSLSSLRKRPAEGEEEDGKIEADSPATPPPSPPASPALDRGLTTSWSQMDTKEVVRDALLQGCLPLAQAYLLHRNTGPVRKHTCTHTSYIYQ